MPDTVQQAAGHQAAGHLLGGAVLVLSFVLLYQRHITAVINSYRMQAVALGAAAAWQGWLQAAPELYVVAAITLAAKAVLLPRIMRRLAIHRSVESALGIFPSMGLGVALVALAILVVLPTTLTAASPTREDLALSLSVVLLGGLMMTTRRNPLTQTISFLSLENGLILGAVGVPGLPLMVPVSVSTLALVVFALFGIGTLDRIGKVAR